MLQAILLENIFWSMKKISYRMLLRQNEINCSSVLLLRDVALGFPMEHEDCHEDYITWIKVLKNIIRLVRSMNLC